MIAASAGNHAQGVAFAAAGAAHRCRIVMPRTTPSIKVDAVRSYGAEIDLARRQLLRRRGLRRTSSPRDTGMTVIPPVRRPGRDRRARARVGLEILRQAPRELGAIFVPIGGGGLISGVAAVVKELRPEVRVIGVQPEDSDAMTPLARARAARRASTAWASSPTASPCGRWASSRFGSAGATSTRSCSSARTRSAPPSRTPSRRRARCSSPPARCSIAGLKRVLARAGRTLVAARTWPSRPAPTSRFARLGYIAERAEVGEHREAMFAVTIPEQPGLVPRVLRARSAERSVTEFNYRLVLAQRGARLRRRRGGGRARARASSRATLRGARLRRRATSPTTTSPRRTCGTWSAALGHGVVDEVLYTLRVPRAPRRAPAVPRRASAARWNISLFHYRNHGAGVRSRAVRLRGARSASAPSSAPRSTRSASRTARSGTAR